MLNTCYISPFSPSYKGSIISGRYVVMSHISPHSPAAGSDVEWRLGKCTMCWCHSRREEGELCVERPTFSKHNYSFCTDPKRWILELHASWLGLQYDHWSRGGASDKWSGGEKSHCLDCCRAVQYFSFFSCFWDFAVNFRAKIDMMVPDTCFFSYPYSHVKEGEIRGSSLISLSLLLWPLFFFLVHFQSLSLRERNLLGTTSWGELRPGTGKVLVPIQYIPPSGKERPLLWFVKRAES